MTADDPTHDLPVTSRLSIPSAELIWRFSRSSGPGGQSVNTSDSRVELMWDASASRVLTTAQRNKLGDEVMVVVASEHRSQLQNRQAARHRLAERIRRALAPGPPRRRPTRPSRSGVRGRLDDKRRRSQVKRSRRRPGADD